MTPQTDPVTNLPFAYPTATAAGKPLPRPSRPVNFGIKTNVLTVAFDSGSEQRRVKSRPRRTFDFQYNVLSEDEYVTIREFFLAVQNCYAFYWTDPLDQIKYTVKFAMDTFNGVYKYHAHKGPYYELQIKLEQVL